MKKKTTQKDRIINYMEKTGKPLNQGQALSMFGIARLAARICELEHKGYVFEKGWLTLNNRYSEQVRIRTYKLVKTPDTENRLEI